MISRLASGPCSRRLLLCHVVLGRLETERRVVQSRVAGRDADKHAKHETASRCHADDPALQAFHSC